MLLKKPGNKRTQVSPKNLPSLSIHDSCISMGSCFSLHIADFLKTYGWEIFKSPGGTIYDPYSLTRILKRAVALELYKESDFTKHIEEYFFNFELHSDYRKESLSDALSQANSMLLKLHTKLKTCSFLFITLGTSHVHVLKKDESVVANCHKIPAAHFAKKYLSIQSIIKSFNNILRLIRDLNPALKIIYTVSPIRHVKIGLHENNLSKSRLLLAIEELVKGDPMAFYFPSYEIILDELRDYRYYIENLSHPNELAVSEVLYFFHQNILDNESQYYVDELTKYLKFKQHKIMSNSEASIQRYHEKISEMRKNLQVKFPFISFEDVSK